MKKYLLIFVGLIFMTACGDSIDDTALQDISDSLENRWEYTESLPSEVTRDELREATQIELDTLERYDAGEFKDTSLYVMHDEYWRELDNAIFILDLADINADDFASDWEEHVQNRSKILHDIHSEYELNLSEENYALLEDVINESTELVEAESIKETLLEINGLEDIEIITEENSISINFPTESVLSADSFVARKTGFPEDAMKILNELTGQNYDNIVISTTNQDVIAVSSYFTGDTLNAIDFNEWEEVDSYDAYRFYEYSDAYNVRMGIWEELDEETKQSIGNMNKDNTNDFWNRYGFNR